MKMTSPTPSMDSINGTLSGGSLDNVDYQSLSSAHSPLTSSPNSLSGASNGSSGSGTCGLGGNGVSMDSLLKSIIVSGKLAAAINNRAAPAALCSLCNDSYTDPKILPCLHTFCRPCLERTQVQKNKVTCAQCNQECNLPAQGVKGLLSDYTVYPDVPLNVEISPNTICTHCKDFNAYANSYCFECNHFYCHDCIVAHYLVNFEYHRVYSLAADTMDIKDGMFIADRKVPCQRHRTEELVYFCLSCNVPICKECTLLEHNSELHEYELISNIGSKQVEYVSQLAEESKAKAGDLRGLMKSLNQAANTLQVQFQKAQNEVHDTFLFYRSMLEERKQEILKELESIFSAKQLAINVVGQKAQDTAEKIQEACEFLERVLKLRSVTECVMYKKLLDSKLLNLLGYVPEISVQTAGDLEFVSNFQAIQVGVRNTFGYIRLNGEDATTNNNNIGVTLKQPPIGRPLPPQQMNHLNGGMNVSFMMNNDSSNGGGGGNILGVGSGDYLTANGLNGSTASSLLNGSSNGLLNGSLSESLNGYLDTSPLGNGAAHHFMNGYDSKLVRSASQQRFASASDMNEFNGLFSNGCTSNGIGNGTDSIVNSALNSFMSSDLSLNGIGGDINGDKWPDIFQNNGVVGGGGGSGLPSSGGNEFLTADDASVMDLTSRLLTTSMFPPKSQIKRQKMIYHCKFGEFGALESQFTEPSGVAVNSDNDIIVADTNNHRIQIFDREGKFKFHFGECGKRDGQLLYPNRVAVIKQTGDIIVTERSPTHQIQIYNKYGQFLRKFGATILQHPRGIAVDNKGRIIVVECKVMRVIIFDQMGVVLQKFGCSKHLEFPNGVVVNDKQEIFISDNRAHCVKVFNYEGSYLRQIGKEGVTNYPIGVGINVAGQILIADNHNNFNLTIFTQDGQLVAALESKVKHAQCFDVALMDDSSVVLASKDYRLYIYRYNHVPAIGGL